VIIPTLFGWDALSWWLPSNERPSLLLPSPTAAVRVIKPTLSPTASHSECLEPKSLRLLYSKRELLFTLGYKSELNIEGKNLFLTPQSL